MAMCVLGQVTSAGASERSWSAFEFIHNKRRNRLQPKLTEDLVFIFSNMQLLRRAETLAKKRKAGVEETIEWQWASDEEDAAIDAS